MKKIVSWAEAWKLLVIIACSLWSGGCGGGGTTKVNTEDDYPKEQAAEPEEVLSQSDADLPPEYKILPLDELEFKFDYHLEFNELATVRPDGRITLHKVGDIYVEGMTPSELDRLVTEKYNEVTATPDLAVIVRRFSSHIVYVLGEVKNPGAYDIRSRMTILQALAAAGGTIRGAKLGSVVVLRKNAAGEPEAMSFDLGGGAIKKARAKPELVAAQDIIYVPRNIISNVSDFLNQVYDGLLPPVEIYLRALYLTGRN
jgi:polysaccharide export outer membrane protein